MKDKYMHTMDILKKFIKVEDNKKKTSDEIRRTLQHYKNVAISGEEGVGKITSTLEALRDIHNVLYIGNPVDYVGKPRPKGYDKYLDYITSLKRDMQIIPSEEAILSFDPSTLPTKHSILVIDEIYGRSELQEQKILSLLDEEKLKVVIIAGCLKSLGRLTRKLDVFLMLTRDGVLATTDREFIEKICILFSPDYPAHSSQ